MAEIEIIKGADNGNPPDTLHQAYPKINRNFQRLNTEIATNKTDANNKLEAHKNSTTAHPAQNITYSGEVSGATNIKQAVDAVKTTLSQAIISGDSGPEAQAAAASISGTTYDTLKDRLDSEYVDVTEQLADIAYLGAASKYGVNPSIGSSDATSILNNYFASLKAKGLKYAFFDKPHTYKVTGPLTQARDLILIGNAEIVSTHADNYYLDICKSWKLHTGKVNSFPSGKTTFKQFVKSLNDSRNIKVTIWGDSISTGGGDCLNISFNNANAGQDMVEDSPNGVTKGDSYYRQFIDMMVTSFKDRTFDFYNRSIGGASIQQYNSNQVFSGVTKTWIEHIKSTACDLLVIGFGMNNNQFDNAKEFKYYLKQIIDYVQANFSPIPMVAVITTPRPTAALEDTWGSFVGQQSRDLAAYSAKKYGLERGCYIVDVNKISNIKRAGKSFENPYFKELAITQTQVDSIISGTYTKSGDEYSLQTLNQSLIINKTLKDFVLEFDVKFSNFISNEEVLWFAFNESSGIGSNVILLRPNNSSNVSIIEMYENFPDSAHFASGSSKSFVNTVTWNDNVYRKVRIEKREDIVDIFIDNVRKLRGRYQINNLPGTIKMYKTSASAGTITIKNIKIYEGKYTQYTPSLTEYEMWGLHEDGVYTTKPVIGGNGVNHPTSIGISETYAVALKELVDDLLSVAPDTEKLAYIPKKVSALSTGGTTATTSGAQLRFFNIAEKTDYPKESRLQFADGTYWTRKIGINDFTSAVNLVDGEFAVYNTVGVTQVVLAKTDFATVTLPLTFWSWLTP